MRHATKTRRNIRGNIDHAMQCKYYISPPREKSVSGIWYRQKEGQSDVKIKCMKNLEDSRQPVCLEKIPLPELDSASKSMTEKGVG